MERRGVFLNLVFLLFLFLFPNYLHGIENESAIFLLDYAEVKVKKDGKRTTLIHQKIKIIREKGRKFAELRIPFDSERQKVKFIKGITITPTGKILKVSQKDIKTVTPAELTEYTALYPGIKTMSISFPGVITGSIIEYKYIVNTFKPLIKGHFWDTFYFQSTEPFVLSKYKLQIPKNIKIKIKEKGVKLKEKKEKGSYKIYIWEKKNVPGIIEEILMPPLREFIPKVCISTFHSWEEIGDWFFNLSKECATYNEEMEELVKELIKGKNKKEKISSIYHYVCQKIRYVGLEIGIHGFKPHNATDVFRLKYGDCKDKSNLMKTMLKIAGIKSYISLINTEGKITEDIPFPGQFNHAIIAIPDKEGFIFLDPTSEVFSFPDIPPSGQNKYTLIASPEPVLIKTPLLSPERNSRKRIIKVKIDEEGKIQAKVKVVPTGIFEASMRESFRYLKKIERRRALARELNKILPSTSLVSFEIKGLNNLSEQLVETYEFSNDFFGIKVKDRIIFRPGLIDILKDTSLIAQKKRNYPLRFGYCFKKEEIINYEIPSTYTVEVLPPDVNITNQFGEYIRKFQIKGNTIAYHRIFTIKEYEISPLKYFGFRKFYKEISKSDRLPVIIRKKQN